jgi:pimeloyl-ACP methyl ester carboxylesterase
MTRLRTLLAALVLGLAATLGGSALAQTQPDIVGPWHGTLTPRGSTGVAVVLTVSKGPDGALSAIFGQPYSGANAQAAVSSIAVADGTLTFAIARANASFEGKWNASEHRWEGVFKQGIADMPLTLEAGKPPARPVIAGMDGVWQGSIERNGGKLRLVLRIATADYGTVVVLDSPDQLSFGEVVPVLGRDGDRVQLGNPAAQFAYDAVLSGDLTEMTGVWKRPNQPDAEVTFTRAATDVARFSTDRPQTPKQPFAYQVEEVAFANPFESGVRLAGTLTLPEGEGPFPAAILISGSGANDRDDTGLGHKPFAVIADYLTRHGIAVLRTDDRGVGGSTGDFAAATSADLATDANAAARYLTTRPDIRRDAIGFIGHSEGGVIAPIAMASNKHIAFLVMLAGPGTRWDEVLLSQRRLIGLAQGKSEQELGRSEPLVAAVYHGIASARTQEAGIEAVRPLLTPDAMAALGAAGEDRDLVARRMNSRWTRYLFRHDPAPDLRKIRVPVLVMTGSLDLQIPADENLPAIRAALIHNPDVTVRELPGLNHLFQTATTGAPGEYADIQETFAPAALEIMSEWLTQRFVRK